jgi:hypothetical protein
MEGKSDTYSIVAGWLTNYSRHKGREIHECGISQREMRDDYLNQGKGKKMKDNTEQTNSGDKPPLSWEKVEEIIDRGTKDADLENIRFENLLFEHQEEYAAAKPKHKLTNDELAVVEKDKAKVNAELARRQRFERARTYLQLGIKLKSDDPNSEIFKMAKELQDTLDRYETAPSSMSQFELRKYKTSLKRYNELLRVEFEKPEEAERNTAAAKRWGIWTCVKRIPRWIYVLVLFLAALLGILEKLGCLDPIKRLFTR